MESKSEHKDVETEIEKHGGMGGGMGFGNHNQSHLNNNPQLEQNQKRKKQLENAIMAYEREYGACQEFVEFCRDAEWAQAPLYNKALYHGERTEHALKGNGLALFK